MSTNRFKYTYCGNTVGYYPFRVGDLVKIVDSGKMYSSYESAFVHFTGSSNTPYFSYKNSLEYSEIEDLVKTTIFKIKGVARHTNYNFPIFYIADRTNRWCVIYGTGLEPYKIYPLRRGENGVVELDLIKQIKR